ncbi:MAG: hypothetical protein Q8Q09_05225 [Deltaproteobacteria bacterium]|nr:hypothetical protein [Deltaproteobacteria bacterium]
METSLASWDLVAVDAQAFNREACLDTLTDVLTALLRQYPGCLVKSTEAAKESVRWASSAKYHESFRPPIEASLRAMLPHWYGREGWAVGNETFGGCICCSLPLALSKGPREGALWIVDELESMIAILRQWVTIIEVVECTAHADPELTALAQGEAAQRAVQAMIDTMVEGGHLSESWYGYIDDGVRWLFSTLTDRSPNDDAFESLASNGYAFSSWTTPAVDVQQRFTRAVGDELVRELLRNRS